MRTHNIPSYYRKIKVILIMPPDLALLSTFIGSNYPYLELILMVPKVFEPLKFYCIFIFAYFAKGVNPLQKGSLLVEQILFFEISSHFERVSLPRETNRKSQKLFPLKESGEKFRGLPIQSNLPYVDSCITVPGIRTKRSAAIDSQPQG